MIYQESLEGENFSLMNIWRMIDCNVLLDNFSLANHRRFAKLFPHKTFPQYGT